MFVIQKKLNSRNAHKLNSDFENINRSSNVSVCFKTRGYVKM